VPQYHYTYLRPRADLPGRWSAFGSAGVAQGDLLDLVHASRELTLVAYSPLLSGAYVRADRPLAQLEENLMAVDLELTGAQRPRLDEAR